MENLNLSVSVTLACDKNKSLKIALFTTFLRTKFLEKMFDLLLQMFIAQVRTPFNTQISLLTVVSRELWETADYGSIIWALAVHMRVLD